MSFKGVDRKSEVRVTCRLSETRNTGEFRAVLSPVFLRGLRVDYSESFLLKHGRNDF